MDELVRLFWLTCMFGVGVIFGIAFTLIVAVVSQSGQITKAEGREQKETKHGE